MSKAKCNHDCFNCEHADCIVNNISSEERREIRERDKRYKAAIESKSIIKQRPQRAKHRGRVVVV